MWEAKVLAVAEDAVADMAETNWKHKVSPDQGDLMMEKKTLQVYQKYNLIQLNTNRWMTSPHQELFTNDDKNHKLPHKKKIY